MRRRTPDGRRAFDADHVISHDAPPFAREIARRRRSHGPEAAELLRYRDFLVVALILDRARTCFPTTGSTFTLPAFVSVVSRTSTTGVRRWSPTCRTCLGCEGTSASKATTWGDADDELIALAHAKSGPLGSTMARRWSTAACCGCRRPIRVRRRLPREPGGDPPGHRSHRQPSYGRTERHAQVPTIRITRCSPRCSRWRTCGVPRTTCGLSTPTSTTDEEQRVEPGEPASAAGAG